MSKVILDCEIAVIPPSVNHYWVSSGKRRFLSERAIDFQKLISLFVKNVASESRLKVEIIIHFGDRRKRDIDNIAKGILDSMCKSGLFLDDEQVDILIIKRGEVIKGGLLKIKVEEI